MNGNEREWAVAFHGIRGLQTFVAQGVINNGLLPGTEQNYEKDYIARGKLFVKGKRIS